VQATSASAQAASKHATSAGQGRLALGERAGMLTMLTSSPPEGGRFQRLRRWEQQVRFAVHRPGSPRRLPANEGDGEVGGVPRRDADGRVHVRVAGETAGSAPEAGLALTRVPVHPPARRAPLAREHGVDLSTRPGPCPPVGAPAGRPAGTRHGFPACLMRPVRSPRNPDPPLRPQR
jgi:hypothetical protein